jgi:hypothetical protein
MNYHEMGRAWGTNGSEKECILSFGGKSEGKSPLGRRRRRWEGNINMNIRERDCGSMGRINLA